MILKWFIFLCLSLLTCLVDKATVSGDQSTTNNETSGGMSVELLVVVDKCFSDRFQHDRQKILDFLGWQIWDANMRFKSIKLLDISFRVTQLIIYKKVSDQPFIEGAKAHNGSVYLQKALLGFSDWVTKDKRNLTSFDIAVLVTGSEKMEKRSISWAYEKGAACQGSLMTSRSTFIVHFENLWDNECAGLASPLSHLLGAPMGTEMDESTGCTSKGYLRVNTCGEHRFFFSKCGDTAMSKYAHSESAKCLRVVDNELVDLLATNMSVVHPPSLQEQCAMFTSNRNAVVVKEETSCVKTKCSIPTKDGLNITRTIYPLDNSPCDNNKNCFRGRCLSRGSCLINQESGKCLHAANRFVWNDYPVMTNCATYPATPPDQVRVLDNGSFYHAIAKSFQFS